MAQMLKAWSPASDSTRKCRTFRRQITIGGSEGIGGHALESHSRVLDFQHPLSLLPIMLNGQLSLADTPSPDTDSWDQAAMDYIISKL